MHDSVVCPNRPPYDVVTIFEVDDDDFGRGILVDFLANANEVIRFERLMSPCQLYFNILRRSMETHA